MLNHGLHSGITSLTLTYPTLDRGLTYTSPNMVGTIKIGLAEQNKYNDNDTHDTVDKSKVKAVMVIFAEPP